MERTSGSSRNSQSAAIGLYSYYDNVCERISGKGVVEERKEYCVPTYGELFPNWEFLRHLGTNLVKLPFGGKSGELKKQLRSGAPLQIHNPCSHVFL